MIPEIAQDPDLCPECEATSGKSTGESEDEGIGDEALSEVESHRGLPKQLAVKNFLLRLNENPLPVVALIWFVLISIWWFSGEEDPDTSISSPGTEETELEEFFQSHGYSSQQAKNIVKEGERLRAEGTIKRRLELKRAREEREWKKAMEEDYLPEWQKNMIEKNRGK